MKPTLLIPFALGCGWLLSPEALVISGNTAGQLGWFFFPLLTAAALLFLLLGAMLCHPALPVTADKEFTVLEKSMGTIPATALSLSACLPLTVLAATALLVTSGYTFNEVFLYWFPNFGFAFLLLALITILQLFPEKFIQRAQFAFVALAAGGLLLLGIYGTFTPAKPVAEILSQPSSFPPAAPALLLLLFAGSTFSTEKKQSSLLISLTAALIFFFWIFASLGHVNPSRLADSTIPYMTASRKILGDPGRWIMGVVVISGSCAAVNGLLMFSRQKLASIAAAGNKSFFFSARGQRWLLPPLVAVFTGILMARGLAGHELLEVLLRGALILWLLHYCLLCISALLWIRRDSQRLPLAGTVATTTLLAGLIVLIFSHPRKTELNFFILAVLVTTILLAAVLSLINKKQNP